MFILASESPRRRELLAQLGYPFKIERAGITELHTGSSPELLPQKNAWLKAENVAQRYPEALVLGADTAIFFAGRLWNKPRDLVEAKFMLRTFSGHTHQVITGLALVREQDHIAQNWSEISSVCFAELDDAAIDAYLSSVQVLDKAGAYAVQEHPELLGIRVDGELANVIGLPQKKLKSLLSQLEF